MTLAAAVLGFLFGLVHGMNGLTLLRAPSAARGSGDPGAIPRPARVAWVVLCGVASAAGVVLLIVGGIVAAVLLSLAVIGISAIAVLNGFWMKGRPTVSHHVVRGSVAAAIAALAVLGA